MATHEPYRIALLARLAELDSRLHAIEMQRDAPASPDRDDMATDREGDEVLEQLDQVGQDEIARIRAALQRMRDGTYGTCPQCGDQIAVARLTILPEAALCNRCAIVMG